MQLLRGAGKDGHGLAGGSFVLLRRRLQGSVGQGAKTQRGEAGQREPSGRRPPPAQGRVREGQEGGWGRRLDPGARTRSRARRRVLEAGRPGWGTGTLEQEARPGRVGSGDCRPRGGSRMEEVRVKGAPRAGGERCRL